MGGRLYHGRDVDQVAHHAGEHGAAPADTDSTAVRGDTARRVARGGAAGPVQQDGDTKDTEEEGEGKTEAVCEGPVGSGPAGQTPDSQSSRQD